MIIETTEHGRKVRITVDAEGVRVTVGPLTPSPMDLPRRDAPMAIVTAGGGGAAGAASGTTSYSGGAGTARGRLTARCPSCGEHHDPKEHAGGTESPAAADGYPPAENLRPYLPTDLRPAPEWRCAGCGSASGEQHTHDCEEYRKSTGGKRA